MKTDERTFMKYLMTWMKCSCSSYVIALGYGENRCRKCGDDLFSVTGDTFEWSLDEADSVAFNEKHWLEVGTIKG